MSTPARVVFDCNTFLQALASPDGPAGACFQLASSGRFQLFVSPLVIEELRRVTGRPRLITKLDLNTTKTESFIATILNIATVIENVQTTFYYTRDPDDAHYVNLALTANARLIVSRDKDLLDLMQRSTPEAQQLMAEHPDFQVLTPPQFLSILDSQRP